MWLQVHSATVSAYIGERRAACSKCMRQRAPTVPVAIVVDCPRLEIGLEVSIETWPELPGVATRSACERARPAMNSVLGMGILNAVSKVRLLPTGRTHGPAATCHCVFLIFAPRCSERATFVALPGTRTIELALKPDQHELL